MTSVTYLLLVWYQRFSYYKFCICMYWWFIYCRNCILAMVLYGVDDLFI